MPPPADGDIMHDRPPICNRRGGMQQMMKPEVVLFPCPGMGHLVSMVELAKQLRRRGFSVTVLIIPYLVPAWAVGTTAYMESVVSSCLDIRFEELPRMDPPQGENLKPETFVTRLMDAYKSPVKDAISRRLSSPLTIPNRIAAVILDWFCTSMMDVAGELGVPAYIYYTSNAAMAGTMLYLPTLDVKVPYEMRDVEGDLHIPGLPPVSPRCMPPAMMDKDDEAYSIFLNHGHRFREAKGIIVNTFAELEPKPLLAVANGDYLPDHQTPPVFPVGPLLAVEPAERAGTEQHECVRWLDGQPKASVVFLCFGSMGAFDAPQVEEMAVGLERSGHRFLWALRSPSSGRFRLPTDADLDEVLPEGFLERTKGRGLVWPSWVPQGLILSHEAVGGFVTHCGWNSSLESLWFGVPMLGWPLFAEQHLNCVEMVKDMGVALELKSDLCGGSGFVSAEELEKGVRSLMEEECEEGKKVRAKVEEMKWASRRATMEGGSSYVALERFVGDLTRRLPARFQ